MKDKIKYDYIEAQVFVACAVCDLKFHAFPDIQNPIFECLRCDRSFILEYNVRTLSNLEMIKHKLKVDRLKKDILEMDEKDESLDIDV